MTELKPLSPRQCKKYFGYLDSQCAMAGLFKEGGKKIAIVDWRKVIKKHPVGVITYQDSEGKGTWIEAKTLDGRYVHKELSRGKGGKAGFEEHKEMVCWGLLHDIIDDNADKLSVKMGITGWNLIWKGEGIDMAVPECIQKGCHQKPILGVACDYGKREKRYIPLWCSEHAPRTVMPEVFHEKDLLNLIYIDAENDKLLTNIAQYYLGEAYSIPLPKCLNEFLRLMKGEECIATVEIRAKKGEAKRIELNHFRKWLAKCKKELEVNNEAKVQTSESKDTKSPTRT